MKLKLSSFIFKRKNVRDSYGDIAFYRIWIDRWEEDREPVEPNKLILHLVANYSPELEKKVLGERRGLVDIPVDLLVSRSIVDVLNGTKFILNLIPPRRELTAKHMSVLGNLFEHYHESGFLFSIHEKLIERNFEVYSTYGEYITYVYTENIPKVEGKLVIVCGKTSGFEGDFVCDEEYEDVYIVNSLKHTQTAVSKLISMLSEEASVDDLSEVIKSDPALVTKLLQYVNSPLFPHRKEIESVLTAINYLGLENLKKFLIAVWMSQFFGQDPSFLEFIKKMLFNAFLMESFSKYIGSVSKEKLFLAGLFYKMPEAFGVRPKVFFESINLPEDVLVLYEDERISKFLKLLDVLDGEEAEEYAKSLGLNADKLKEHINYAEKSISVLMS